MWLRHTQDVISIVISLVALGWLNSDSKGNFWWYETYQKMNSPCLRTFASGERVFFKFKATSFKSRPAILKKLRETTNLGVQRTDKTICKRKYWTTAFTSPENSCVFKSSRNAPLHLRMSHSPRVRSQFTLKNIKGGNWTNQKESQIKRNQMTEMNGLSRNNFRIINLLPFLRNERKLIWDLYHSTVKFRK